MGLFWKVRDRSIIENESEYKHYLATLRKKNDKSFFKKYTIIKVNLDEFVKILNDFVTTHKKIDFCIIKCEFIIKFDNNFTTNTNTNSLYNTDINNIKSYLLYYIDCFKSTGYTFKSIIQMTINSINDRCNITYEECLKHPTSMMEKKINMNISKNPQLITFLDRNKNHPLIRKYSNIPFSNYVFINV